MKSIKPSEAVMTTKCENSSSIFEVFRKLCLETEEDREHFRYLAFLGTFRSEPKCCQYEQTKTKNNTLRDEEDAELESIT
ncbi:MAG: hypothetical protein ACYC25_16050 [Paludibacter sp.]